MARRVLITGATGTVGRATIQQLASGAHGLDASGATRSSAGAEWLRSQGMTPVELDFDRPETLRPALEGKDAVFLMTGYTVDMLVHSTRLLHAARAAGVPHVVHLGALSAEDSPHAQFAWHRLVESAISDMGFAYTHLHPNFFMDTVWAGFSQRPDRVVHFIADQPVSWVSAQDIAAVAVQALQFPERHAGNTYPLAVEALSMGQLAGLLSQATGTEVRYRPRPAAELLPILLHRGMDPAYAAGLAASVAQTEAGALPLADAVYDTVRQITGRPPVTWEDFIRQQLARQAPP